MPSERRHLTAGPPRNRTAVGPLVTDPVPARYGHAEDVVVVYDGGIPTLEIAAGVVPPPGALRGWAWSDPPQTGQRPRPLPARRIAEALRARADGCGFYLEDGGTAT
ncbi:hypothetical protein ACQPYA_17975 [Micromonospora sp. CA-263727]|uniref:hypothetical protein n=1 Tax=Micromonospora sp. CA-263727 TaxID=3239967 RepID=UPI003D94FB58